MLCVSMLLRCSFSSPFLSHLLVVLPLPDAETIIQLNRTLTTHLINYSQYTALGNETDLVVFPTAVSFSYDKILLQRQPKLELASLKQT